MMRKTKKQSKNSNQSGFVRIIAGLWKGKKLPVHDVQGLRPTTDRVKETVFNWLMFDVANKNVLDCFAGSGSLGFEALSRGADQVTLIEQDKRAYAQLVTNAQALKSNQCSVHHANCIDFIASTTTQFDLVFVDPPFRCDLAQEAINRLVNNNALEPNAFVYLEVEAELQTQIWPDTWQVIKEKTAGQVCYRLLQVA